MVLLLLISLLLIFLSFLKPAFSRNETKSKAQGQGRSNDQLIEEVHEMFNHSFTNYLRWAFPHDELKPISGNYTDSLPELGNGMSKSGYFGLALTLIDSLDTLAVFGWRNQFKTSVTWIVNNVDFNIDLKVNVFETNIRLLGGLLSGHVLAEDHELNLMPDYGGELLGLAEDLADRLLPAFSTSNNIPYAWVNLAHGNTTLSRKDRETCLAGAGTLILEFGALSYFTENPKYFQAANLALLQLWEMRSELDLMGNQIDGKSESWINTNAGIGAGSDSYYEYVLKAYIMFGNDAHWSMFLKLYNSINKYMRKKNGMFIEVKMASGRMAIPQFNSLQAFWPGLQVLKGDLAQAIETQASFFNLWTKFDALPERVMLNSVKGKSSGSGQAHGWERNYPLRPELIESAYHLYRATNDVRYKQMGAEMLNTIQNRTRVRYGYAVLQDVVTGKLADYMPSYFLAETVKYLLLLFDDDHWVHQRESWIFSTEGHFLPVFPPSRFTYTPPLTKDLSRRKRPKPPICKPFSADLMTATKNPFLLPTSEIKDIDQIQCKKQPDIEWSLTDGRKVQIGFDAGSFKINFKDTNEKLEIRNLGSQIAEILNGKTTGVISAAYVDSKRNLLVSNTVEFLGVDEASSDLKMEDLILEHRSAEQDLGTEHEKVEKEEENWPLECEVSIGHRYKSSGAFFFDPKAPSLKLKEGEEVDQKVVVAPLEYGGNGCEAEELPQDVEGFLILLSRGKCTFYQKSKVAQSAGALGVIIGNHNEWIFMMSGDGTGRKSLIPAVMIGKSSFKKLKACYDLTSERSAYIKVAILESLRPEGEDGSVDAEDEGVLDFSGSADQIRISTIGNGVFTVRKQDGIFTLSSP